MAALDSTNIMAIIRVPCFLFLTLVFSLAHAEEDISYLFSKSLEELLAVEVAGASFSVDSLADTAASVTVFTENEIQQLGLRYMHELANLVPGFQSKRQSNGGRLTSVSSRGRQISTATRSVTIIVNGQTVSSGYDGSSMSSIYLIPLENISKVEFIRGPGSVVFGSGALLGVINIETYQDIEFAKIGLGSNDYVSNVVNYGENDWHFSAISRSDQGDSYSLKDTDSGNRIKSKDPHSEEHFYLTKNSTSNRFSLHHHRHFNSGFYVLDRVDNDVNSLDHQYSSLSFSHFFTGVRPYDIAVSAFYNLRKQKFSARLGPPGALTGASVPASSDALQGTAINTSAEYGVKAVADWPLFSGHITLGSEYHYLEPVTALAYTNFNLQQITQQDFPVSYYDNNPVGVPFIREKENQTLAIFSEYQHMATENLNCVYSLRYDYSENISEGKLLPRFALTYRLTEHHYLKAIHSRAFRNPSETELGAINNGILMGDEDLASETVTSNEIIWFAKFPNLYFNISYYNNQFYNLIEQDTVDGLRIFKNQDKDRNQGIEIEYRHELTKNLSIRTSFSRLTEMLDSSFRISENTGSMTLSWLNTRWSVNLISVYQSKMETVINSQNDHLILPSFWHHNLAINYQHTNNTQSQLLIDNIQGDQYQTPTISPTLDEGIPSRGRVVIYSVKFNM